MPVGLAKASAVADDEQQATSAQVEMHDLGRSFADKYRTGPFKVEWPDRVMSSRILVEEMGGP